MALSESTFGSNAGRHRLALDGTALRSCGVVGMLTAGSAWTESKGRRGAQDGQEQTADDTETFRVEQVLMGEETRVVIHGGISRDSLPRLRTVIDGLLLLRPPRVTVEVQTVEGRELLWFLGRGRYSTVRVCASASTDEAPAGIG